jgi:hypothetical protein
MKSSLVPKLRPRSKTKETTLRGRPLYIDETGDITGKKGTKYSEQTVTIPFGTGYIVAPSVDKDGSILSREEVKQKLKDSEGRDFITGEKLPTFETVEEADKYAKWRSSTMDNPEEIERGYPEKVYENVEPEKEESNFYYDMGSYAKGIGKALAAIGLRKFGVEYYPTEDGFNEGGDVIYPELKPKRRSRVTPEKINSAVNAQPKKGMGYVELLVDNIIGLDNKYESFGEKLGTEFNKDELGFLKNIAVGAYEGAKEFVTSPIDTTKSVVKDIADSVQRLGTEDLDMRLKRMYNVTYADATDEQVNRARESVFGDALTALELVPAGAATAVVAKKALKSGAGKQAIDFAKRIEVDPNRVGMSGGNIRLAPKDTSDFDRSQITPVQRKSTDTLPKSEVSPLIKESTEKRLFETGAAQAAFGDIDSEDLIEGAETSLLKDEQFYTRDFYSSITTALENRVGKKGISGKVAKKYLEENAPNINKQELYWSGLLDILEDDKVYNKDELLSLAKENTPQVEIEVLTNPRFEVGDQNKKPLYGNQQRITRAIRFKNNDGSLITLPPNPDDFDYAEILIRNKNKKTSNYSDALLGHWGERDDVISHARVTYIDYMDPNTGSKDKSVAVVDELQSDAVQNAVIASKETGKQKTDLQKKIGDTPTLGDIALHYELELSDFVFRYVAGNVPLSKKFKDKINSYNYNFDSITDQDTAETAIRVGLIDTVKKFAELKDKHIRNEITYEQVVDELAKEFNLKKSAITRKTTPGYFPIVDDAFLNVLGDYVFTKKEVRNYNKNNDNLMRSDLIDIFEEINVKDFEDNLVPLNLTGSVRTALLGVIKDSKERGINKIIIPPIQSILRVREGQGASKAALKATYEDAAIKVLKELKSETNGRIDFKRKEDDLISFSSVDMRTRSDPNIIPKEGIIKSFEPIIIDISDFEIGEFTQFRFAEGGSVENMDGQMEMIFEEGGIADDGTTTDPVSGNEVPPGSLAKEVRDDVPARLSEGEYVVPADVVRFYGVKFFEDLRTQAKMGLQDMEENGRIGGEPIERPTPVRSSSSEELSSEELEFLQSIAGDERNLGATKQEMTSQINTLNEGGQVKGYYNAGMVTAPYQQPYMPAYATPGGMTVQASAPYIGGVPTGPAPKEPEGGCPEGMMWDGTMCVIDPNYTAPKAPSTRRDDDDGPDMPEVKPWYEDVDLNDTQGYINNILAPEQKDESLVGGLLSNMPIVQAVGSIGKLSNVAKARAALEVAKVLEVGGNKKYSDKEIEAMEATIDKYIDDNNVNRKLADTIATGRLNTSSFMNKADKNDDGILTPEEIAAATGVPLSEIIKQQPTTTPTKDDGKKKDDDGPPSSGPSYGYTYTTDDSGQTKTPTITSPGGTAGAGGGMTGSDTRPDDPRGEGQYGGPSSMSLNTSSSIYDDDKASDYDDDSTGINKGGLIKKKKKK